MKTLNICPSFTQNIINATLAKKKKSLPGKQSLRRRLVCRKCTSGQYMRICSTGREDETKLNRGRWGQKCQLTPWQALKQRKLFRGLPNWNERPGFYISFPHTHPPPQPHQFIMKCSLILERSLTGSGDSLLLRQFSQKVDI